MQFTTKLFMINGLKIGIMIVCTINPPRFVMVMEMTMKIRNKKQKT